MANPLINARNRFSAQHPETRQTINTRNWGVLRVGDQGPNLVLLPGTLGRADIFWNQITDLGKYTRILALSYPEAGTLTDWCADITTLMSLYNMEKATVLGSSLGGYLAQYFAATQPDRIDNLIAANTLHSVMILANLPPYNADLDNLPADALMQGFMGGLLQWQKEDPARENLVDLLITEVSGRIPVAELRNRLRVLKDAPELPQGPLDKSRVSIVDSGDDRLIPPPVRDAVRAHLGTENITHFEQGSHFPYLTNPAAYSALIAQVLGLELP